MKTFESWLAKKQIECKGLCSRECPYCFAEDEGYLNCDLAIVEKVIDDYKREKHELRNRHSGTRGLRKRILKMELQNIDPLIREYERFTEEDYQKELEEEDDDLLAI